MLRTVCFACGSVFLMVGLVGVFIGVVPPHDGVVLLTGAILFGAAVIAETIKEKK